MALSPRQVDATLMASGSFMEPPTTDLLVKYFVSWRPYRVIIARLREVHGITRSIRWLKMQFRRLGLCRRSGEGTPIPVVKNCIMRELRSSNSLMGYRAMWKHLREKYDLRVQRDTVMKVMRDVDPEGVRKRATRRLHRRVYSSKGPNFVWHMDQYDKLATFGFYIHGCIDGFSRKIMWLKVASTNRDSNVILGYYLEAVEKQNGCPQVIRMDRGSENSKTAEIQVALRMEHTDALAQDKSIRYGSSPSNSRIESWWSRFRSMKMDWWISTLKELTRDGWYDSDSEVHRQCMAVGFLLLIQRDAESFVAYWNSHCIRYSRAASCPSGRPDDMFDMPNFYGAENCLKPLNRRIYNYAWAQAKAPRPFFDDDFYIRCNELTVQMFDIDLFRDISHSNCVQVYKYLVNNVRE